MSIPLYADAPEGVIAAIRRTPYLGEVASGEVPVEETGLWDLVRAAGRAASAADAAAQTRALPDGWNRRVFVLARDGGLVVGVTTCEETLRVAPRSALEVVQRLALGAPLAEFRALAGDGIYDAYA